ncbi:unnamed protein product [Soboliphyme baturini]|uniref:Vacuolar protein sorting-associated protein 33A n=1 Tax=Soboliphyme baturini TaxID=241478 RepID=A0A183INJ5_9BILA|nr:unnamed protein product [Soboliphyme baturini]
MLNCLGCDNINSFLEDCINKKENLLKVMRLLCLQFLVCGRMKAKMLNQYRKEILQSYGYNHMPLLLKLQKAGLLNRIATPTTAANRPEASGYRVIRKLFRQIVDNVDEKDPNDSSYVYSGYGSLLVRLCEYWLKPGWRTINEYLMKIPGDTVICESTDEKIPFDSSFNADRSIKRTVLVLFVGGATLAEISALRFVAAHSEGVEFIVATTSILTGDRLIQSFA